MGGLIDSSLISEVARRAPSTFATATPARVAWVIMGCSPDHAATSGSRPSICIPSDMWMILLYVRSRIIQLVEMQKSQLWILLSRVNHRAHLVNECLHLLLSDIQLFSQVPILPLQFVVLVLQLLLVCVLFLHFCRVILLHGGSLPLPFDLGGVVLCDLIGFLARLLDLLFLALGILGLNRLQLLLQLLLLPIELIQMVLPTLLQFLQLLVVLLELLQLILRLLLLILPSNQTVF